MIIMAKMDYFANHMIPGMRQKYWIGIRNIIKYYKKIKIGGCIGVFICILFMFLAIYFSTDFVADNLSQDGLLTRDTEFLINFIRLIFGILSTAGLIFSALCVIKPDIFIKFYSIPDEVRKKLLKLIIFLFPIVFVICTVVVKSNSPYWYKALFWREDSIIEWLTFVFYLIAFIVSCKISITFYRSNSALFCFMYMLLSIGFFFVTMEEISWGQRIFNVPTPEFLLH